MITKFKGTWVKVQWLNSMRVRYFSRPSRGETGKPHTCLYHGVRCSPNSMQTIKKKTDTLIKKLENIPKHMLKLVTSNFLILVS